MGTGGGGVTVGLLLRFALGVAVSNRAIWRERHLVPPTTRRTTGGGQRRWDKAAAAESEVLLPVLFTLDSPGIKFVNSTVTCREDNCCMVHNSHEADYNCRADNSTERATAPERTTAATASRHPRGQATPEGCPT